MKLSQTQKILEALKDAGREGLHPTYFIVNLHIYQYNARIYELREMFGCECKHSTTCSASEHIRNRDLHDGTTRFYYVNTKEQGKELMRDYARQYHQEKENTPKDTLF